MLFCHRGSKASTPPPPTPPEISTRKSVHAGHEGDMTKWQLPAILTAGSLDELSSPSSPSHGPLVMPVGLEAQLASLSTTTMDESFDAPGNFDNRKLKRHQQQPLLSSASMHSLVSSTTTSQEYSQDNRLKRVLPGAVTLVDGNLSLPSTHKKHHQQYSGLSLLSLSHYRSGGSELRKLRSLDVQQFSSLLDFEERYNDPWVGSISLRRTSKRNLEDERHRENSIFLSILEAKGLQTKRRYYCDVCLDRTLYARTTSKQSVGNSIFWAEEFDLNNLPDVSILTVSLYREAESGSRDFRRGLISLSSSKKYSKKSQNRLIGFVTLPVTKVCLRNPAQTWLSLQSPTSADFNSPSLLSAGGGGGFTSACGTFSTFSTTSSSANDKASTPGTHSAISGTGVQLRVSVRYRSVDVLPISAYLPLHTLVQKNGIDFIAWFEHLVPLKLKEEVASCLVSLHERVGTATSFLTELVVREVSSLENESMTFRSNTMATKAVESYIKLVGKEYLHNLLHRYIQRILICNDTWEVDPDKLSASSLSTGSLISPDGQGTSALASVTIQEYCAKKRLPSNCDSRTKDCSLSRLAILSNGRVASPGSLIFSQTQLLQHLDLVWEAICASLPNFPKPLLLVFSSFRAALEPIKGPEFCDKLISACIFLRFLCPAILTPSLFGLASTFPGEANCQRNLTLIAKSLQSLANLTTFGDKESFMKFMNVYVEAQIPVMRSFLRDISTSPAPLNQRDPLEPLTTTADVDCGYELACLQSLCFELLGPPPRTGSPTRNHPTVIPESGRSAPPTSLPPALHRLPEIIDHLENVKNGTALEGSLAESASLSALTSAPFAAPADSSLKTAARSHFPHFYLSFDESVAPEAMNTDSEPRESYGEKKTPHSSPLQKPTQSLPKSMWGKLGDCPNTLQQPLTSNSLQKSPVKLSSSTVGVYKEEESLTPKERLIAEGETASRLSTKATSSRQEEVDYDDPYNDDETLQSTQWRSIHDVLIHGEEQENTEKFTPDSGVGNCPPSAFSLYKRSLVTSKSGNTSSAATDLFPMDCSSNSAIATPSATPSATPLPSVNSSFSSGGGGGLRCGDVPRHASLNNKTATHLSSPYLESSLRSGSGEIRSTLTTENLVLEPLPNPVIMHMKPFVSMCSMPSASSSRSAVTNRLESTVFQHQYPFRRALNTNLIAKTVTTPSTSTALVSKLVCQKMSTSVNSTFNQTDHGFGKSSTKTHTSTRADDSPVECALGTREVGDLRRPMIGAGLSGCSVRTRINEPLVFMENEQLLSSTLEELGDAVAWLERERNDMLSLQDRRLQPRHTRAKPSHAISNNFFKGNGFNKDNSSASMGQTSALSSNIIENTPITSQSPTTSTSSTIRLLNSHTSTPSLHWFNDSHQVPDQISSLNRSTNSLTEQFLPHHHHHHHRRRSAVSRTFTLNRSGSASVSPSRRNREDGSDSSDARMFGCTGCRKHTTTTLILAGSGLQNTSDKSGDHVPLHQTSVSTRGIARRKGCCEEEASRADLYTQRRSQQ